MGKPDRSKMELVSDDAVRAGGLKLIAWAADQGWTNGLLYMVCSMMAEMLEHEGVEKIGDEWIGVN